MFGKSLKEMYFCDFCGKSQDEVKKIIKGPDGPRNICICNVCVSLCVDIVNDRAERVLSPSNYRNYPPPIGASPA